ncbi:CBS domain-containing protein [Thalassobacillus sp. CUG 92003]|uniref:CBS domain-containing protein n=1 Tax=Thalassobacillus sp. CUG 92003 TaxID=2736641 RepID=UPI0015E68EDC
MFVKTLMKPKHQCYVADVQDSLADVLKSLDEHDILGMPVLDGDTFIGMISTELIYRGCFNSELNQADYLSQTKTANLVGWEELAITEDEVFEHTLPAFKGFPVLAVVDRDRTFLGLVTRDDVLEQFESAFGVKKKGVRIAFTSEDSAGRIERLGDIIKSHHENVISLTTFDETDKLARRIVLKVDASDNIERFTNKLERTGFRILSVKEV